MLKFFFYTLIFSLSIFLFSACIAERKSSTENQSANGSKVETKSATENNTADSGKSADKAESEKSKNQKENSGDVFEKTSGDSTEKSSSSKPETRCGWYENPTPGNHWLTDKDGEWTLGTQGGFQAEGDYPPEFSDDQWVKTNINYGYGCACLSVTVDRKEMRIIKVFSGKARPLSACRSERTLNEPSE